MSRRAAIRCKARARVRPRAAGRQIAACGVTDDRHRDDHDRRHRRPRVSRARGRREAARARLARVLARHARRHGGEARARARRRLRGDVASAACAARDCKRLLLGPFALLVGVLAKPARSSGGARPTSCSGSAASSSFPGALMASRAASRWCMHDANAVAGLANRVLAYGADRILLGFPGRAAAARTRARSSGSAIRCATAIVARRRRPKQRFAGRTGPLQLLVVGGSLGAAGAERARAGGARAARRANAAARRAPGRRAASRRAAARLRGGRRRRPTACHSSTTWRARYARGRPRHLPRRRD